MARVTFDTLKFVERLKAAGIPEAQAKAFAEAQREVFAEALDSSLASHSDLERIERKLIEHDGEFKLIKYARHAHRRRRCVGPQVVFLTCNGGRCDRPAGAGD